MENLSRSVFPPSLRHYRFGAIWCDLVLIGGEEFKVQGSRFKVQGSRFKVQGSARNWKRQKLPIRAAIQADQALLDACFHLD
jgi:hypothetical protein